jgi:hypothetical protein
LIAPWICGRTVTIFDPWVKNSRVARRSEQQAVNVMVVITSRLSVTCADSDQLYRAAVARAEVEGVSEAAYRAARSRAAVAEAFDLETVLRFAVRSAGCGTAELAVSVKPLPRPDPARDDDVIAVDRLGDRS